MKMVFLDAGYGMVEAKAVKLSEVPDSARYDCTCTDFHNEYDLYWDGAKAYAVECK